MPRRRGHGVRNNLAAGTVSGVVPVRPVALAGSGEMHGADRVAGGSLGDGSGSELLLLAAGSGSPNVGSFTKTSLAAAAVDGRTAGEKPADVVAGR